MVQFTIVRYLFNSEQRRSFEPHKYRYANDQFYCWLNDNLFLVQMKAITKINQSKKLSQVSGDGKLGLFDNPLPPDQAAYRFLLLSYIRPKNWNIKFTGFWKIAGNSIFYALLLFFVLTWFNIGKKLTFLHFSLRYNLKILSVIRKNIEVYRNWRRVRRVQM